MLSERMAKHFLLNGQAWSQYLLDKGLANKILIVDLDVHQGNGTAEIFPRRTSGFHFFYAWSQKLSIPKRAKRWTLALDDNTDVVLFSLSWIKISLN